MSRINLEDTIAERPRLIAPRLGVYKATLSGALGLPADGPTVFELDPNGSDRTISLPTPNAKGASVFYIKNTGSANVLNIVNHLGAAVTTIGVGGMSIFVSGATSWSLLASVPLYIADGTEALPGLAFSADTNNGIYRIGADNWGLVAGGQKKIDIAVSLVRIEPNAYFGGDVSVGINSFGTYPFYVYRDANGTRFAAIQNINAGTSASAGIRILNDTNTYVELAIHSSNHTGLQNVTTLLTGVGSALQIYTGATQRIAISATGPVTFLSTAPVTIASTTASTLPTNGALIVAGGAGFGGAVNSGGIVSSIVATASEYSQCRGISDTGIVASIGVGNSASIQPQQWFAYLSSFSGGFFMTANSTGRVALLANVVSTAYNNGTLVVTGGVGISDDLSTDDNKDWNVGSTGTFKISHFSSGSSALISVTKVRDATNTRAYRFGDVGGLTGDANGGAGWRGFQLASPTITDPSGGANVFPLVFFYWEFNSLSGPTTRNFVWDASNLTATTLPIFRIRINAVDQIAIDPDTNAANTGQVRLVKTTPSTSTTTGALRVDGGVGIAGAANIGTYVNVGGGSISSAVSGLAAYTNLPSNGGRAWYHAANAASRDWVMQNDIIAFGDFNIRTGTAKDTFDVTALYITPGWGLVPGRHVALATNATDGFLYIPTCAGTPTGVPAAYTGKVAMVFDTTNNKLYIYDGGWLGGTTPGAFV